MKPSDTRDPEKQQPALPASPVARVQVWYAYVTWLDDLAWRQRCLDLLDASERAAHARFVVRHAQEAYLLAHALCRLALSAFASGSAPAEVPPQSWQFGTQPKGKPTIIAPAAGVGLQFNLSHCQTMVAVAVCEAGPVGVDVEDARRTVDVARLSRQVLTPQEQADCLRHPAPGRRFLQHWTLKEAYLKAQGVGIAGALQAIEMPLFEMPLFETPLFDMLAGDANLPASGAASVPKSPTVSVPVRDFRPGAAPAAWDVRLLPVDEHHLVAVAAPGPASALHFVWNDATTLFA